ncbi:MAG: uncharacterized protein JWR21_3566, partial [Herminiimonas sp.]|nr:uncharacterized protein [Herminiimonas sp.]
MTEKAGPAFSDVVLKSAAAFFFLALVGAPGDAAFPTDQVAADSLAPAVAALANTSSLPPAPPTTASTGPTYYVSTSGNDANAGSQSAPWRTIQKAANTLVAGDTAVLLDGTYEEGSVNFTHSGTAAKPITIRAQNKWQAILGSTSGCDPGFSIGASYITVKDIRFSTSPRNGQCGIYTSTNVAIRAWNSVEPSPSNPTTGNVGFVADGIKVDGGPARSEGVKSNQDFTIIQNSEFGNSMEIFNS